MIEDHIPKVVHDGMEGCRKDNVVFVACNKKNNDIKSFFCYDCRCFFLMATNASSETLKETYPPREGLSFSEKEGV